MLRALTALLGACVLPACLGESPSLVSNDAGVVATDGGSDADVQADAAPDAPDAGCRKDCLGGACVDGKCQPVVIAPVVAVNTVPTNLVVQPGPEGWVFYTTYLDQKVWRVSKDGSVVEAISKFPTGLTINLTMDADRLFVTTFNSQGVTPVFSMLTDGTNHVQLGDKAMFGPSDIANDEDYVYWGTLWDSEKVVRAPKAGGPREVLYATAEPDPLTENVWAIELDETDVYFGIWGGSPRVAKRAKDGSGPLKVLAKFQTAQLQLCGEYVYYSVGAELWRVPKSGSHQPEKLANFGLSGIDDGYVYWAEFGHPPVSDGALRRMSLRSKEIETLVDGLGGPGGVAFDDVAVYWTNQHGRTVMKLAK